jgi:hypothetical protein
MIPNASASMMADVTAKKWLNFFEAFRASSTTSPDSAKSLSEIGITDSNLLHILVRRKVVVHTEGDKYYLDEDRLKQTNQLRNRLALIPLVVIAISLLALLFYH